MNVGNFVAMSMYLAPFAFFLAPLLFVAVVALGRMAKRLVQTWYAQRAMRKGAVCYRKGDNLVVHYTK